MDVIPELVTMGALNIFGDLWNGIGATVSTVVSITHDAAHMVQEVAGVSMDILHTALDVLNIPWTPHP